MQLANRGWPEGLRRIKDQVKIIDRFISAKQPRKELAYAVRGPGILDFSRYQQGRPDAWTVWQEVDDTAGRSAKIVPIVFNVAASSGVDKEVMFHRGASVCALIDILEHSNIRVELTVASAIKHGDTHTWTTVVKHSEDVLDMDRVAFALCQASVLRRLGFSLMEQQIPNLMDTYGIPASHYVDGAINLDGASLYIRNESDMIPWLVKQLANYGVEVED
jgi:hypothetical protein